MVQSQSGPWQPAYVAQYLQTYDARHTAALSATQAMAAMTLAGTPRGCDVLDAPCGAGRHSTALARLGYRVTGIDSSTSMLAAATRRAPASPMLRWVAADYRGLPFGDASFDTVLNLFTSLGFGGDDEDQGVLHEFRRVQRPGGRLVIDTTHRDRLVRSLAVEKSSPAAGEGPAEVTFDPRSGWLRMVHISDGGAVAHSHIRVYTPTELSRMLARAGFGDIELFGDLDGSPFDWDTRLIVTATR